MADQKISQLTSATTLTGVEVAPVVQSGTTKKSTIAQIAAYTPQGKSVGLLANNIPFVLLSSGIMGNNGALSGVTAVSAIYPAAYVYLDANAIFIGSAAGWYYAVFSSTTAAKVYNNTYTSGTPTIPANPTAFVTTGPGAYVRITTNIAGPTFTLPANTLSETGYLDIKLSFTQTNNANTKNGYFRIGGSNIISTPLFSTASANILGLFSNAGIKTTQYSSSVCSVGTAYSTAATLRSVNTAANQTLDISINSATVTDTVVLNTAIINAVI